MTTEAETLLDAIESLTGGPFIGDVPGEVRCLVESADARAEILTAMFGEHFSRIDMKKYVDAATVRAKEQIAKWKYAEEIVAKLPRSAIGKHHVLPDGWDRYGDVVRVAEDGMVCTFGALALKRRTDAGEPRDAVLADLASVVVHLKDENGEEPEGYVPMWEWAEKQLAAPSQLAWEIVCMTDDDGQICTGYDPESHRPIMVDVTPAMRYERMVRSLKRMLGEQETA